MLMFTQKKKFSEFANASLIRSIGCMIKIYKHICAYSFTQKLILKNVYCFGTKFSSPLCLILFSYFSFLKGLVFILSRIFTLLSDCQRCGYFLMLHICMRYMERISLQKIPLIQIIIVSELCICHILSPEEKIENFVT